jgi:hypothetical protein
MPASVFDKLEEIYPNIINMMPDDLFNTHEFMLKLVQNYQELYVQALMEYSQNEQPSLIVIEQIAKALKERKDLITYVRSEPVENVFEQKQDFEVWQKVRKQP